MKNANTDEFFYSNPYFIADYKYTRDCTVRAYCAIRKFIRKNDKNSAQWKNYITIVNNNLIDITSTYIKDKSEQNNTLSSKRNELKQIIKKSNAIRVVLENLSARIDHSISVRMFMAKSNHKKSPSSTKALLDGMRRLEEACEQICTKKLVRSPNKALQNACLAFWKMREKITGKQFIRTWSIAKGEKKKREFVNLDALFVQVALQAIDPNLQLTEITNSLKSVARSQSRQKSTQNKGVILP